MASASHGQSVTGIDGVGRPTACPAVGPVDGGVGTVDVPWPADAPGAGPVVAPAGVGAAGRGQHE